MTENTRVNSERNWAILKEKLLHNNPPVSGSRQTVIDGFVLHCFDSNNEPKPEFYQPVIIVVVQGKKWVRIGDEEHHFGENLCFVAGVDMPAMSCVMEASRDKPYLSMSLSLDQSLLADLAAQVPPTSKPGPTIAPGAIVQHIEPDLLDAFLRLLELTEKPEQAPVMGELLLREIHYRLLTGPFGPALRSLSTFGSQGHQISQSISWLKNNYKEPLSVEQLAGRVNMASSTFHKHFKEVTTLSPLQYQKRLRLSEARRLLLTNECDVTQAAFAVGYESATQFIREYKRLFGDPPRRDVTRMKARTSGGTGMAALAG